MRHFFVVSLASGILVLGGVPVLSQNLVANPNFDTDTTSWSFTTVGSFTHNNSLDADDNAPASGSGQLVNGNTVAFGTSFAAQCVTSGIVGGNAYDWGARVRFDTGNTQTATGRAALIVSFFDGASCSGNNLGTGATVNVNSSSVDTWVQNEVLAHTAPTGAVSAQISLFTNKVEDTGVITVNFDNVVLGPAGILPVELQSFVVE